jgi:hypothetical protein
MAVRLSFLKSPTFFIAAPVIFIVCMLEVLLPSGKDQLELMTFDWRVQLAHRFWRTTSKEATNLGLLDINDNTIYEVKNDKALGYFYGLYWPRDVYAAGLKELTAQGAKAVAFDVLFAEVRNDQGTFLTAGGYVTPDDIFAEQLQRSSNAILAADTEKMPNSRFGTNAWQTANITVDGDADGVLRRDRAFLEYRDWSPAIEQAEAAYAWDLPKTIDDRARHKITFISQLDGEQTEFSTDDEGRIAASNIFQTLPPGYPDKIVPYRIFRAWSMGIVLAAYELKLDLEHPDIERGRIVLHGPHGLTRSIPVDKKGL